MSRAGSLARGLALALLCAACVAPGAGPDSVPDIQPGERPDPQSEEADFWMMTDRAERQIKTSGRLVKNPAVNAYVRDVVCTIAGPYCGDIRVYVVRVPDFNASMMPNGTMQVWTGLLLRAQNEAQLAYVIGHEIGHFLRRHTLKRFRDIRTKTDALVFVQLAVGAAGYGYVGDIAQLLTLASIFAYGRDQERESDDVGFRRMVEGGYDPHEAAKIWQALIAERDASDEPDRIIFFASHPSTEERVETLNRLAAEVARDKTQGATGQERYRAAILPFRGELFRDELRARRFDRLQVVLDHHFEAGANVGELYYFQGELYRLRGEDGDDALAIESYRKALARDDAPPETYRDLGLVLIKTGERVEARRTFELYLATAPGAEDRAMVESYIAQLE